MKYSKFEYLREFVSPYYYKQGLELESPGSDILKKRGLEGWELCAVSTPDSSGVEIFYFKREN